MGALKILIQAFQVLTTMTTGLAASPRSARRRRATGDDWLQTPSPFDPPAAVAWHVRKQIIHVFRIVAVYQPTWL